MSSLLSSTTPGPLTASGSFRRSDFRFELPESLIAQHPLPERSASRLLMLQGAEPAHRRVRDLPRLLRAGDRLVFNDTRVLPARLKGHKPSGGQVEVFLERVLDDQRILAKVRASKTPKPGAGIIVGQTRLKLLARHQDLFELAVALQNDQSLEAWLHAHGEIPLPPYIQRAPEHADDERYQTVYAREPGAVAAPTAGLHFDQPLLQALRESGIDASFITLHVGAGTFQPVRVDDLAEHVMHHERIEVSAATVAEIEGTRAAGGRIIAVGTTCVRALEAAAAPAGVLQPLHGETDLFLTPGSRFNVIDAMLTNFHLPESTLLMLVCAFCGMDRTLSAYQAAVQERYRFFSYGDAMLAFPATSTSGARSGRVSTDGLESRADR